MTNSAQWYSAKVRLVCTVDSVGATSLMECMHVFTALGWDEALRRAIDLGRQHESTYLNAEAQTVRWRLKEVVSLDLIRAEALDGAEVHSSLTDVTEEERKSLEGAFRPEDSRPVQTF